MTLKKRMRGEASSWIQLATEKRGWREEAEKRNGMKIIHGKRKDMMLPRRALLLLVVNPRTLCGCVFLSV